MATHYRTCCLCEAMCGIAIEHEGGRVRSIRGDADDPFSEGDICPKAVALGELHADPDRLRRPMRREGDSWREIGWEEALEEAGRRLGTIQARHGRDAVALYVGNPTVHSYSALLSAFFLFEALGTRNRFSATSADQLPHMLAALRMFGNQFLFPVPDIDRTDFFLALGANPLVSGGSMMSAPGMRRRLDALRDRGGRLVVVDPSRTRTARRADLHLAIRPGTDALLLLSFVHVLFDEGLVRPGRLADFTDGIERIEELVALHDPESTASRTGLEADRVRALVRDFAAAERAVAYGRIGVSTQSYGGICAWLLHVVNVLTGNLDRPGGSMFTTPAADLPGLARLGGLLGSHGSYSSRVRGLPEFGGELPVATLAEEIETPGDGRIRALVTHAGNPVLSAPGGRRIERALAGLDFMVAIDFYRNETTRHADLILPPPGPLERDHFDLAFNLLAVRNTAKYSPALFDPGPDARADHEILLDLAGRIARHRGGWRGRATRIQAAVLKRLGPRRMLEFYLRLGPSGLRLADLEAAVHGIDLGPLEERLPARLATRRRRIDLVPSIYIEDCRRLGAIEAPADDELVLIGRRQLRSCNSWLHNCPTMVKGPERCTLRMHPRDASARRLVDGQAVRLASATGAVEVSLELDDDILPGVVSLPHGWGHDRPGTGCAVAAARPGASINDVTDEGRVDPLSGTAAFNATPVEVTAVRVAVEV